MQTDIQFYSERCLIKGHLHTPNNIKENETLPAIILCQGFAGVKEMLLPPYAKKFSEAGYIVLNFDYRGFGESEGNKGDLIPLNQITDIRNAITYISSLKNVDKTNIGLWGSSYGGANAISTASVDNRVTCIVAQLTFGNGERVISNGKTPAEVAKVKNAFEKAWQKQVTTNRSIKLPVIKFLTDEQSQLYYKKNVDEFEALKVTLPFTTMKETFEYKPEDKLHGINTPIFFVGAENDAVNPVTETVSLFDKANKPKDIYIIKDASHYDVYEGKIFDDVASRELAWFNTYLKHL